MPFGFIFSLNSACGENVAANSIISDQLPKTSGMSVARKSSEEIGAGNDFISWPTSQVSHDPGWRGTCSSTERDSWGRCAVAPGWPVSFNFSAQDSDGLQALLLHFLRRRKTIMVVSAVLMKQSGSDFFDCRIKRNLGYALRLHFFLKLSLRGKRRRKLNNIGPTPENQRYVGGSQIVGRDRCGK